MPDGEIFIEYKDLAKRNREYILSLMPQMNGVGVKTSDDLLRFPLAYGITHRGELRRFVKKMEELHQPQVIKVLELVDDVNFGLPQQAWTIIALHKASKIGRPIFFNLNHMEDVLELIHDRGKFASTLTSMELRYIYQNWELFQYNVSFWLNDCIVKEPWVDQ